VPIGPFLDGEYFEPELIDTMGQTLGDACSALGLKDKEDAAVRLLAIRIIKEAREGVHDRVLLKEAALKGFVPAAKFAVRRAGDLHQTIPPKQPAG
jgi:hypothetical protein